MAEEMNKFKKKLKEEKEALIAGLFVGFILGVSLSYVITPEEGIKDLGKQEIGQRTEKYVNDVILARRNVSVEHKSTKKSEIPGLYNVTLDVPIENVSISVFVSMNGEWFLQGTKMNTS